MKLPFSLKRRKKGDDEDDEFDLDDEEALEDEDEDGEDFEDEEDLDDDRSAWERMDPQRKILIISALAGGLLLAVIIGGAAFFLLGTADPDVAEGPQRLADGSVAIPSAPDPESASPAPAEGGGQAADAEGGQLGGQTLAETIGTKAEAKADREPVVGGVTASQVAVQAVGTRGLGSPTQGQDPDRGRVIPFTTNEAYKGIQWVEGVEGLARVPDLALVEEGPNGRDLPTVARNGTRPMDAYARPIAEVDAAVPQVAILIRGIGLSRSASLAAIKGLPPEVSMVISPYARDPEDWVIRARLAGHEVFLGLPMESANFPFEDAGPLGLDTGKQVDQNMATLMKIMGMIPGYVGFVTKFGSKFGVAEGQLKPIFEEIKARGLMFVDSGESGTGAMVRLASEMALPKAQVNIHLDAQPTEDEIASRLLRLGALARSQSVAVAMGEPYPHTIRELKNWLAQQPPEKLRLVPVSAVADKQIVQ